jgi:hypothetical protein
MIEVLLTSAVFVAGVKREDIVPVVRAAHTHTARCRVRGRTDVAFWGAQSLHSAGLGSGGSRSGAAEDLAWGETAGERLASMLRARRRYENLVNFSPAAVNSDRTHGGAGAKLRETPD